MDREKELRKKIARNRSEVKEITDSLIFLFRSDLRGSSLDKEFTRKQAEQLFQRMDTLIEENEKLEGEIQTLIQGNHHFFIK